ncbi:MAG: hypothetical protein WC451_00345 [Patescibacteria group bacterium]|jgi:hypothetical protein
MTEQSKSEKTEEISEQDARYTFFFEVPLYEVYKEVPNLSNILIGEVDGYNPIKKCETTFEIEEDKVTSYSGWDGFRKVSLTCKRYGDKIRFFILRGSDAIMKIGQYPSLADIQFEKLGKKYDRLLSEKDLKNFKKAIGLAAHGVGAGSLIYLRKIFEDLVNETFNNHVKELATTPADFKTKRMEDKVEIVKKHLPQQVLGMKPLYSILSSGIHYMEEEDCLSYFAPLKLSIELILDEKIETAKLNQRDEEVKKALQQISGQLKIKS